MGVKEISRWMTCEKNDNKSKALVTALRAFFLKNKNHEVKHRKVDPEKVVKNSIFSNSDLQALNYEEPEFTIEDVWVNNREIIIKIKGLNDKGKRLILEDKPSFKIGLTYSSYFAPNKKDKYSNERKVILINGVSFILK